MQIRNRYRERTTFVIEDEGRVLLKKTLDGYDAYKTHTFSRASSPDLSLIIKKCSLDDLDDIMDLQDKVIAQIPDKFRYIDTSREDVAESLIHDICIGAYLDIKLVGFTILLSLRTPTGTLHITLIMRTTINATVRLMTVPGLTRSTRATVCSSGSARRRI
jgi:hypothetical protein